MTAVNGGEVLLLESFATTFIVYSVFAVNPVMLYDVSVMFGEIVILGAGEVVIVYV
jgi:hypothetical protein